MVSGEGDCEGGRGCSRHKGAIDNGFCDLGNQIVKSGGKGTVFTVVFLIKGEAFEQGFRSKHILG